MVVFKLIPSQNGPVKRIYVLLILNILGVAASVFTTILLSLWALNLIFPEPNTAPIIQRYLQDMRKYPNNSIRIFEYDLLL